MEQQQFDALAYFAELGRKNRLAQQMGFVVDYCRGFSKSKRIDGSLPISDQTSTGGSLAAVIPLYRDYNNFIFIDDTTSGKIFSNGTGWFTQREFCVHILAGYDYGDAESYNRALELCRKLFRQMLSRIIKDKESYRYGTKLMYLNTGNVYSNEYGRYSLNGCTGLFFQIQNDEPTDLVYDENEWEE